MAYFFHCHEGFSRVASAKTLPIILPSLQPHRVSQCEQSMEYEMNQQSQQRKTTTSNSKKASARDGPRIEVHFLERGAFYLTHNRFTYQIAVERF
jgi:hypothetical protein